MRFTLPKENVPTGTEPRFAEKTGGIKPPLPKYGDGSLRFVPVRFTGEACRTRSGGATAPRTGTAVRQKFYGIGPSRRNSRSSHAPSRQTATSYKNYVSRDGFYPQERYNKITPYDRFRFFFRATPHKNAKPVGDSPFFYYFCPAFGVFPSKSGMQCGSSSGVEHQLPKLRVAGSNPVSRS